MVTLIPIPRNMSRTVEDCITRASSVAHFPFSVTIHEPQSQGDNAPNKEYQPRFLLVTQSQEEGTFLSQRTCDEYLLALTRELRESERAYQQLQIAERTLTWSEASPLLYPQEHK